MSYSAWYRSECSLTMGSVPSISSDPAQDEQSIARNVQALKNRLRGRGGRRGGRGGRIADASSGKESHPNSECVAWHLCFWTSSLKHAYYRSEATPKKKSKAKTGRKWGDEAPTESEMATLDFSAHEPHNASGNSNLEALVDKTSLGTRTQDGMYEVKDWEFASDKDTNNAIANALKPLDKKAEEASGRPLGALGSLFARLTGSKVLSQADLKPVLDGMKQHLMKKNVAMDIAEKVCEGVGETLIGQKVGGFQSAYPHIQSDCPIVTVISQPQMPLLDWHFQTH